MQARAVEEIINLFISIGGCVGLVPCTLLSIRARAVEEIIKLFISIGGCVGLVPCTLLSIRAKLSVPVTS